MKEKNSKLPPQLTEALTMMAAQALQFQRTIWLMAKEAGGVMTIDEAEMNPLWQIKYNRPEGSQTRLTIKAEAMPEPTEEQIRTLAGSLLGKKNALHEEAQVVGLHNYPGSYIMGRLAPLVVNNNGTWVRREQFDAETAPKS